jgi:hypothetical protein
LGAKERMDAGDDTLFASVVWNAQRMDLGSLRFSLSLMSTKRYNYNARLVLESTEVVYRPLFVVLLASHILFGSQKSKEKIINPWSVCCCWAGWEERVSGESHFSVRRHR